MSFYNHWRILENFTGRFEVLGTKILNKRLIRSDELNKNNNLTISWQGVPFSFLGGRLWVLHTFYSGNDQNCAKQDFIVSLLPFQHVLDYWKGKEDLKVGMETF